MEARFYHHGAAGRYYKVTADGMEAQLVVVTEGTDGSYTFDFLGAPLGFNRKSAMSAVIAVMP